MATLSARSYHMSISPIRQVFNLAESIQGAIRLEIGEPDFRTPDLIVRAAQEALEEGWTRYTPTAGIMALREALARYDAPKLGRTPDPAREILVTVGATNGLYLGLMALLNPGDEVLVPDPGWPQYHSIIQLAGGVPVPFAHDPGNGFRVDRETVMAGLSTRTKAILINSPHNPTGCVLDPDDLGFFAGLAGERDLWVVSDEVYERIIFDGLAHRSIAALPEMAGRTVVVGAFSKTFAMTGWRLGHVVGPPAVVDAATKFQQYVNTSSTAAVQRAGVAALGSPRELVDGMVAEFQARRDAFMAELGDLPGVRCVVPRGAFYVFPDFGGYGMPDVELATHLLRTARVSSVPGSGFGSRGRGFLRFSFVRSPAELRTAVRRIREALDDLPR